MEDLAPLWRRAIARLLDAALVVVFTVGVAALAVREPPSGEPYSVLALGRAAWFVFALPIVAILYEVAMVVWRKATLGKLLLGLEIVTERGRAPGFGVAVSRTILPLAGFFVPLPPVGILVVLAVLVSIVRHPRLQGWHDRAAGTLVISS
jgi:uncharacterized RDD family membrane protein YckC